MLKTDVVKPSIFIETESQVTNEARLCDQREDKRCKAWNEAGCGMFGAMSPNIVDKQLLFLSW